MRGLEIGAVICLLLTASACGGGEPTVSAPDSTARAVTTTEAGGPTTAAPVPTTQTSPTTTMPTATTEPTPTGPTVATTEPVETTEVASTTEPTMVDVKVYFLRGERLMISHRPVDASRALRGALDEVLDGPTPDELAAGLSTEIPRATTMRSVTLADGQATIDLTGDYETGGGTLSMMARFAQLVFTATQFDDVDRVVLRLEGQPVSFLGGEGLALDGPQERKDVDRAFTGGVLIDTPRPGATVGSTFVVTGEGDLFEGDSALWVWRDDVRIAGPFLVQAGAWGTWDEFETTVTLDVAPGPIELILDDGNGCTAGAAECGEPNPAIVPLTLSD